MKSGSVTTGRAAAVAYGMALQPRHWRAAAFFAELQEMAQRLAALAPRHPLTVADMSPAEMLAWPFVAGGAAAAGAEE